MEKLDLSVNMLDHFLCQGDSRLGTPHKQINLTSQSENRTPNHGPGVTRKLRILILDSFEFFQREKRYCPKT